MNTSSIYFNILSPTYFSLKFIKKLSILTYVEFNIYVFQPHRICSPTERTTFLNILEVIVNTFPDVLNSPAFIIRFDNSMHSNKRRRPNMIKMKDILLTFLLIGAIYHLLSSEVGVQIVFWEGEALFFVCVF